MPDPQSKTKMIAAKKKKKRTDIKILIPTDTAWHKPGIRYHGNEQTTQATHTADTVAVRRQVTGHFKHSALAYSDQTHTNAIKTTSPIRVNTRRLTKWRQKCHQSL